jgi:DNA-binding XRE family transcriptional regulator
MGGGLITDNVYAGTGYSRKEPAPPIRNFSMTNNIIGNNIKKVRISKWMMKGEFGEYMNMSIDQIEAIEDGLVIPNSAMILKFSKVLNCSLNSLMNKRTVKLKTKERCRLLYK